MKIPAHVETGEDVIRWGLDATTKERDRRIRKYGKVIDDRLLNILPLFRMTHSQRARKCFRCGNRIAEFEIHFVLDRSYVVANGSGARAVPGPCTPTDSRRHEHSRNRKRRSGYNLRPARIDYPKR